MRVSTFFVYLLLIAALGTFFLPTVRVRMPPLGERSWSIRDLTKSLPKLLTPKEEKESRVKLDYDFIDLVMKVLPPDEKAIGPYQVSPTFLLGILVPFALIMAYLFLALGVLLVSLRKGLLFLPSSLALLSSGYALGGTYCLGITAQRTFTAMAAKAGEGIFGIFTRNLVQQITIQPDTGLFALVILTGLLWLANLLRKA